MVIITYTTIIDFKPLLNTKIINPAMISNITNLRSRVSKLYILKTKAMLPLFEVVSNSIHAIFKKKEINYNFEGKIEINLIRVGAIDILKESVNNDKYPIKSIEVIDNGVGLNNENFVSLKNLILKKKQKLGVKELDY